MSTFGWFALIVLPILGGLIAWAGDVIGYRLGKGRHSLFGLRPRTTARLIGIAVGVALPLVGVGAALLGSSEARDALFHIGELRQRQAELLQQNQDLEAQQQRTEAQAQRSEQRAMELRGYLTSTQNSLGEARQHVAATNRQLGIAQQEVRRAAGSASRLQALIQTLKGQLSGLQDRLTALNERLTETSARLAERQDEVTVKGSEVTALQAQVDGLKSDFADVIRLINSPVELETGHELVRTIVEVGDDLAETEDRVLRVLITAGQAAAGRGAEPGPNGLAVRLIRPLPPNMQPGEALPDQAAIVEAFSKQLQAAGKRTFVIGVRVARRMYHDEVAPVGVELWALPYVRVFLENQLVYKVEIDGSLPRPEVFKQLWNLVTKIVRREAKENGLLADPVTGEYGGVNFAQLFEALDAVTAHKGPVVVRVVAAADTYITDPLLIRIEVGEGGTETNGQDRSGG